METSVQQVIENCSQGSYAGILSFGENVGALMGAGVESYQADYRARTTTYYMPDGATSVLPLKAPADAIPEHFDAAALQQAIRGAQRGEVKYPEFLQLSRAAGCVGYMVWIAGRHVAYMGRRGDIHVEHFPASK